MHLYLSVASTKQIGFKRSLPKTCLVWDLNHKYCKHNESICYCIWIWIWKQTVEEMFEYITIAADVVNRLVAAALMVRILKKYIKSNTAVEKQGRPIQRSKLSPLCSVQPNVPPLFPFRENRTNCISHHEWHEYYTWRLKVEGAQLLILIGGCLYSQSQ